MSTWNRKCRIVIACALLVFSLAARGLSAAEHPEGSRPSLAAIEVFLQRLWTGVASLWSENGCSLDPNGGCAPWDGIQETVHAGCSLDPDGRCRDEMSTSADNGCSLDPDGRCGSR